MGGVKLASLDIRHPLKGKLVRVVWLDEEHIETGRVITVEGGMIHFQPMDLDQMKRIGPAYWAPFSSFDCIYELNTRKGS